MRVFISWSGEESRKVANALAGWIRPVINAAQPWTSEDIDKGSVWFGEITNNLSATDFGIVCVTQENRSAPWLLFEAGAVWKATERARVCTYLFDVGRDDLKWPLKAFQATTADRPDTLKMMKTLNVHLDEGEQLTEAELATSFGRAWQELADKFDAIRDEREEELTPTLVPTEIQLANIAAALNRIERAQLESSRRGYLSSFRIDPRKVSKFISPDDRISEYRVAEHMAAMQISREEAEQALTSKQRKAPSPEEIDSLISGAVDGEGASVVQTILETKQETDPE